MDTKKIHPIAQKSQLDFSPSPFQVGAHILSGNCFEPRALNELIPDWQERDHPQMTPVTEDKVLFMTHTKAIPLPKPPHMQNHGNYILSLSQLVRWLGQQAEELGVEVCPHRNLFLNPFRNLIF
jgi:electron-transferring-flavoprotein dehydrogenase